MFTKIIELTNDSACKFLFTDSFDFWVEVSFEDNFLIVKFQGLPTAHGAKKSKIVEESLQKALKKCVPKTQKSIGDRYTIRVESVYPENYRYPIRKNGRAYISSLVEMIRSSKMIPYSNETKYEIILSSRVENCKEPYTEIKITPRKEAEKQ